MRALTLLPIACVVALGCTADITATTRAHMHSTEKDMYAAQALLSYCRVGSTAPNACEALKQSLVEEAQTMRMLQGLQPLVMPTARPTPKVGG